MKSYFDSPYMLFAAAAALPAAWYVLYRFRRICEQMQSSGRNNWGGYKTVTMLLRTIFFSLAWIFLTVAAAGPHWGTRLEPIREQGAAVIFALDISRSMTADDIQPSRLEFAARFADRLAAQLPSVPCGLVLFKGEAVLSIPVTINRRALSDGLQAANPALLTSHGSVPAQAIKRAASAFPPSLAASRYIILLSDGEQTAGALTEAAAELRRQGITLITIGVGTESGAEINAFPSPDNVRMHRTRLEKTLLEEAAREAGGSSRYIQASLPGSALAVLDILQSGSTRNGKTLYASKPIKQYPFFLTAALVFFCAAIAVGGLQWKRS